MKSLKFLGITLQELGALLGVRELLKARKLVYLPNPQKGAKLKEVNDGAQGFNMTGAADCVRSRGHDCGTAYCIGGAMAFLMKDSPAHYVANVNGKLKPLFYPNFGDHLHPWANITAKQAVKAIDNFLAYGNPRWDTVVGLKKKRK